MDLNTIEYRLMILECLRENATNMRIEQETIRERISQALARARDSLASIRLLNIELEGMQLTVENALVHNIPIGEMGEDTVEDASELTFIAQDEIEDENIEEILGDEFQDVIDKQPSQ